MGVNSSNVDKRTRLIPSRCVSELCKGTLCCPHWREKRTLHGESSVNYERKTTATRYSWFRLSVWFSREEKGGDPGRQAHSFHSLEELLVCRSSGVYVSHPQSKNTITYWEKKKCIHSCFILEINPSQLNENKTASGHLWKQNRKHFQSDSLLMLLWFSLERLESRLFTSFHFSVLITVKPRHCISSFIWTSEPFGILTLFLCQTFYLYLSNNSNTSAGRIHFQELI